jgi:hypothetical protein
MNKIEKLLAARQLLHEVEAEFLEERRSCPYEIGFTLRNLDEAIEAVKNLSEKS